MNQANTRRLLGVAGNNGDSARRMTLARSESCNESDELNRIQSEARLSTLNDVPVDFNDSRSLRES